MNDQFRGFVQISASLTGVLAARNTSGSPAQATATPTYRVYDADELLVSGSASGSLETGTITATTNASPIAVTSTNHGLQTGNRVTITNCGTGANGTWTITKTGDNTFTLDTSTAPGSTYSSGTWTLTGLYSFSIACTTGNGFAAGKTYSLVWSFTTDAAMTYEDTFAVV